MREGDRVTVDGDIDRQVFTIVRIEQWGERVAVVKDAENHSYKVPTAQLAYAKSEVSDEQ